MLKTKSCKEPTLEITLSDARQFKRFLSVAVNEAIENFLSAKEFCSPNFIALGKFLEEIEQFDARVLSTFLAKYPETDDLPF